MTIIDFHTHAFPDSLAERAIKGLEDEIGGTWKAKLDGTISSLIASMDAAGIDQSVVCPIATKPDQFDGILRWCLSIRSDRIIPLASVHPAAANVARQVGRVVEAGLAGLKLHPMYQDFDADAPHLDPLYTSAAEAGLPVVLHCGFDIAYPNCEHAHPHRIAAIIRRHPDLTLVATHLGGWKVWDGVRRHLVGRDVWFETSFSLGWMNPDEVMGIISAHGVERVLFGTDSPWADQAEELRLLDRLPLADDQKAAILGGNAISLLAGR